ncbi:MAG: DUF2141 domain-containing protein [Nevskia sp.]|nr:DUF2141 domain-containing protein [Nevskia sp.]
MRITVIPRIAALLALSLAGFAHAGTLEVQLSNLRPTGQVRVSIFADAQSWEHNKPLASQLVPARDTRFLVRFSGLAPGHYAVRAEQEQGGGHELVQRLLLARYGTSGNRSERRTPFAAAAVEVIDDPLVDVHMFTEGRY